MYDIRHEADRVMSDEAYETERLTQKKLTDQLMKTAHSNLGEERNIVRQNAFTSQMLACFAEQGWAWEGTSDRTARI